MDWQNASQFSSAACLKVFKGLLCESIELASFDVTLDRLIESLSLELLEPGAKPFELLNWQLSDRFFDVFKCRHGRYASSFGQWANYMPVARLGTARRLDPLTS